MFEGAYPPGVTGADIDRYFGNDIPEMYIPDDCCEYCKAYDGDRSS